MYCRAYKHAMLYSNNCGEYIMDIATHSLLLAARSLPIMFSIHRYQICIDTMNNVDMN